jgi:hypothetical protein
MGAVRTTCGQGWDYSDETDGPAFVVVGQNSAKLPRFSLAIVSSPDPNDQL